MGREQLEPGANISTGAIGNDGLVAFVALVQGVGNVVADVVLPNVFRSEETLVIVIIRNISNRGYSRIKDLILVYGE